MAQRACSAESEALIPAEGAAERGTHPEARRICRLDQPEIVTVDRDVLGKAGSQRVSAATQAKPGQQKGARTPCGTSAHFPHADP